MRRYYFRVDGGDIYSIATGHIMRCLKLADFIASKEKAQIYFIMRDYPEGVVLVNKKFKVILLTANKNIESEIRFIKSTIPKNCYFICDIRHINNKYISEIKKQCYKFILFDDLGVKYINPDILINPTPFCYYKYDKDEYPNISLLLGEDFFFIKSALIEKAYVRGFNRKSYNIMASFGGADPCDITKFFIKNFVPKLRQHTISIVLGPAYKNKYDIIKKYRHIENIKFYTHLSSLDNMFLHNDIAFVCGGDTCIESCANGLAIFIISTIYYEKEIGKLLHRRKIAYFVTDIENIKNNHIDYKFVRILKKNKALLRRLSKHGKSLVDGRGLERVYNELLK